jgi:uncharacterized protein (TIGR02391 family)
MTTSQQPNYRVIATSVGELLKRDCTVNEIGRQAAALFRFHREDFPNSSITSKCSKLIFDWILSLAREEMESEKRQKLLIDFSQSITPDNLKPDLDRILRSQGVLASGRGLGSEPEFGSRGFHREVFKHARTLFLQGHYFHAVFESAKAYNNAVKEKAQSCKDGQPLMLEVWGADKGVLKVTPCQSDTDRNVQDGIKFLSAGLMQAIRNPHAHETALDWPISKEDAMDILSFISFLWRQLDKAVFFKP